MRTTPIIIAAVFGLTNAFAVIAGAQCVLNEDAKLTPDETTAGFGFAVSLSGDTAVVGARADDGPGAAYVFVSSGGGVGSTAETNRVRCRDG